MRVIDSIHIALHGLRTNRFRSILTILGIVIGITAIIMMMSIGRGAENLILGEINRIGAESIIIRPGREPSGPSDFAETILSDSLKKKDIELLRKKTNVPNAVEVMPLVIVTGSVSYKGETFRPFILGSSAEFMVNAYDIRTIAGVMFDDTDIRRQESVAVIGSKVKRELFGGLDPIGDRITIKGRKFKVVGVFEPRGQVAFFNIDELIIIPHTTAQAYLLGIDHYHEVIVRARDADAVARTVHDIEVTLRESHGIEDPSKDDFFIVTQQGAVEQIQSIISALTAFLSSVVAIALVVGGVGVMNIMFVSVTERTKEIGLRKAVGATEKEILTQFLFEAMILTSIGGLIGIILGSIFSFVTSLVLTYALNLNWNFVFPFSGALLGLGVSALVGLIFGIYPAYKAAKKDPIDALRYE